MHNYAHLCHLALATIARARSNSSYNFRFPVCPNGDINLCVCGSDDLYCGYDVFREKAPLWKTCLKPASWSLTWSNTGASNWQPTLPSQYWEWTRCVKRTQTLATLTWLKSSSKSCTIIVFFINGGVNSYFILRTQSRSQHFQTSIPFYFLMYGNGIFFGVF